MKKLLANLEEIVASFFMGVLLLLTMTNVLIRYTTGRSLAWTEEISFACFAWVVFVGASAVYKRGMHSSIDLAVHCLPRSVARGVAFCVALLLTAAIAVVFYLSFDLTWHAYSKLTPILHIPYTYIDLSITTGFLLMLVHSGRQLWNIWHHDDYREIPLYRGMMSLEHTEE